MLKLAQIQILEVSDLLKKIQIDPHKQSHQQYIIYLNNQYLIHSHMLFNTHNKGLYTNYLTKNKYNHLRLHNRLYNPLLYNIDKLMEMKIWRQMLLTIRLNNCHMYHKLFWLVMTKIGQDSLMGV